MPKPKIFHLITRFIKGGADENTLLTILGLKDRYDITLGFGNEYDQEQVGLAQKRGIKTKTFSRLIHNKPGAYIPALLEIYLYLKQNKFDIIHVHSTEAGIIGRIAARLAGIPIVIYTLHGSPFSGTRGIITNWLIWIFEIITAPFTAKIITNADNLAKEYLHKKIGAPQQYQTVYSGIEIEKFERAKPIKELRDKSGFNIGFISRITEGKGYDEALAAMHLIKNKKAHLFIAGDGELLNYYRNKNNNENITFLGYRPDIDRIIASCDLIILPSYREGTPRCITEAMAASKPVIATNIAGIPEQVEDNKSGFLVPIKNSELLAQKMEYLINNPKLAKKMGKEGYKRVNKFSSDKMVRDIGQLYAWLYQKRVSGKQHD